MPIGRPGRYGQTPEEEPGVEEPGPLPVIGEGGDVVMGPRSALGMDPRQEQEYLRGFRTGFYEQRPIPLEKFEKYMEGQQATIGAMSPGALINLQRELAAVGLLSGDYSEGTPDEPTKNAFAELLGVANQWETSWRTALTRMGANVSPGMLRERGYKFNPQTGKYELASAQFQPEALQLQLPNKMEVDKAFRTASIDMLGQAWGKDNIDAASNAYIAEVTRLQQDAYNRNVERERELFSTGATDINVIKNVQAPTAETFAEEEIKRKNPQQYQTNTGMELLMGLIDQWS